MMFHFHKWSDWSITERGQVLSHGWKDLIGTYIRQERFCKVCGKTQISSQKTTVRADVIYKPESKGQTPKHDKVS